MPIVLSTEKLDEVLIKLHKKPDDTAAMAEFLEIMKPICKLTLRKFPTHLSSDIEQELSVFIMKKAAYIVKAYIEGKIKNPTGYFFRTCYNAAETYLKKELKHEDRLMSIDDAKVEPVVAPVTYKKHKIIEQVREDVMAFIALRFSVKYDRVRAEKYVSVILAGKRPSFTTGSVQKFYGGQQDHGKEVYSIVLLKIRELLAEHYEELTS